MKEGRSLSHYVISEVHYIENRLSFPINWLQKQEFCEYQIFLENIKGITVKPTKAMIDGKQEHEKLYSDFAKEAVPATFDEMLNESKKVEVLSRELWVADTKHGIHGLIDEVLFTPKEFIVIDDKPGRKAYLSNIHQVHGYCLAFKDMAGNLDGRQIVAALRERGTNNLYWQAPFSNTDEESIVEVIRHIHALMLGCEEFNSSGSPNKCRGCRFMIACDRAMR